MRYVVLTGAVMRGERRVVRSEVVSRLSDAMGITVLPAISDASSSGICSFNPETSMDTAKYRAAERSNIWSVLPHDYLIDTMEVVESWTRTTVDFMRANGLMRQHGAMYGRANEYALRAWLDDEVAIGRLRSRDMSHIFDMLYALLYQGAIAYHERNPVVTSWFANNPTYSLDWRRAMAWTYINGMGSMIHRTPTPAIGSFLFEFYATLYQDALQARRDTRGMLCASIEVPSWLHVRTRSVPTTGLNPFDMEPEEDDAAPESANARGSFPPVRRRVRRRGNQNGPVDRGDAQDAAVSEPEAGPWGGRFGLFDD